MAQGDHIEDGSLGESEGSFWRVSFEDLKHRRVTPWRMKVAERAHLPDSELFQHRRGVARARQLGRDSLRDEAGQRGARRRRQRPKKLALSVAFSKSTTETLLSLTRS